MNETDKRSRAAFLLADKVIELLTFAELADSDALDARTMDTLRDLAHDVLGDGGYSDAVDYARALYHDAAR
jgi:hypothetical protein